MQPSNKLVNFSWGSRKFKGHGTTYKNEHKIFICRGYAGIKPNVLTLREISFLDEEYLF